MNKCYYIVTNHDNNPKWVSIIEQLPNKWRYIKELVSNGEITGPRNYQLGNCEANIILHKYKLIKYNSLEDIMADYFELFI